MIVDELKSRVHLLTNQLQIIIGYAELNQCPKAIPHAIKAGAMVSDISHILNAYQETQVTPDVEVVVKKKKRKR